ncbi:hypothetical protein Tco_1403588 [Tanacetum coccineum]
MFIGLLPTTTTTTSATTATTLPLPPQLQQGPSDPIIIKRIGELEELIVTLVEENQALEECLGKQGSRINKLETMDLPKMIREQTDSIRRDECEDFDVDKDQEETKKKSKQDSLKPPPGSPPSPPPPPPPPSGVLGASGITEASDFPQAPPTPPPSSSTHQGGQSTSTTAPSSWLNLLWMMITLQYDQADLVVILHQSNLTSSSNKDLEYPLFGRKIGRTSLVYLKMKAAFIQCRLRATGIISSGLKRSAWTDRAVRTHMRILSVVRIEVFSMYGYNYMKKIILRRADLKEYVIAERDFKYMYPNVSQEAEVHRSLAEMAKNTYASSGSKELCGGGLTRGELPEHPSDTKVLTMKMEILLEPTSNKLLRTGKYGDFDGYTSDDPILKLEILSRRFVLR